MIGASVRLESAGGSGGLEPGDENKSRRELLEELLQARRKIVELEVQADCGGAETALQAKDAELQAMLDALPDLVMRLDRTGRFLDVKSPTDEILSRPVEQIVGRNICDTGLPFEVVAIHRTSMAEALRTRQVQTFEYVLAVSKGVRDFEGRAVACGPDEVLLIVRDITEAKQARAEHRALESELHQARKMESMGRLAGGVAHNLNNLLAPIFGYAEMLLVDPPSLERSQDYLQTILQAADGARDLTRQLLAISHKQVPEIRRIDLRQVVAGFGKILRQAIREDIALEICQGDHPVIVEVDVSQVEQILLNLAINAQDAMPNSGRLRIETRQIEVPGERPGESASRFGVLQVSDTGTGIDEAIREQIFEPFFTTKEPGKGTGLGLATVQAIVRQHGGDLRLHTAPGEGSSFEILLPYGKGLAESLPASLQPSSQPMRGGDETVLVAEDNEMVNRLVCRILGRYGYTVLTAQSGDECLRLAQSHEGPLHLLLTDVVMPQLNGRELHEQLQSWVPDLRVLYMSGYADEVIQDHGVLRGVAPLIQKPFSIPGLLQKVREALVH